MSSQIPVYSLTTPSQHPVIAIVGANGSPGVVTSIDGETGAVDLTNNYVQVVNASQSIATAIATVNAAGGGTVFLADLGTPHVPAAAIGTLPSGVSLMSWGATVKLPVAVTGDFITTAGNQSIRGIKFDGQSSLRSNALNCIKVNGTTGVVIEGNEFRNFYGYPVQGNGALVQSLIVRNNTFDVTTGGNYVAVQLGSAGVKGATISGNYVKSTQGNGLQVICTVGTSSGEIVIANNRLDSVGQVPIEVQGSNDVTITGNIIKGSGTNGISLGVGSDITITGNTIRDQSVWGIELGGCDRVTVSGNTLRNNAYGITVTAVPMSRVTIANNVIDTLTGSSNPAGIRLWGAKYAVVTGNVIIDPKGAGIYLADSGGNNADDCLITGNSVLFLAVLTDTPIGIRLKNTARTVVRGNKVLVTDDSQASANGPITIDGTCADLTIESNDIVATTVSACPNTGINLTATAVVTGLRIVRNKVKNFAIGIKTTLAAASDTLVFENEIIGCTTARALNAGEQTFDFGGATATSLTVTGIVVPATNGAVIYKTGDTGRAATVVLADDPHLLAAIGANEKWVFEWTLFVVGTSNTPDINLSVTTPAGATGQAGTLGLTPSVTTNSNSVKNGAPALNGAGSDLAVLNGQVVHRVWAYISNGATAGNVALQWAQGVSDPSTVTLKAGSYLVTRQVL